MDGRIRRSKMGPFREGTFETHTPRPHPPRSRMHTGVSVLGTQTGTRDLTPRDWRIYVCMTTEMALLIPYPSRPHPPRWGSLTDGHRSIGSRNPNWPTCPNSTRLTYPSVYDSRDDASEPAPSPSPPSSITYVHRSSGVLCVWPDLVSPAWPWHPILVVLFFLPVEPSVSESCRILIFSF
jgi:hypothetical protein